MIDLNRPGFILPLPLVLPVAFGGAIYPDRSGTFKVILQEDNKGKKRGREGRAVGNEERFLFSILGKEQEG